MSAPGEITILLHKVDMGDKQASDQLFRLVEQDLKAIAKRKSRQVLPSEDITLTGLVDEAFCKLIGSNKSNPETLDRKKFFSYAATKIHNMLIDNLRKKQTVKHSNGHKQIPVDMGTLEGPGEKDLNQLQLLLDLQRALDTMPADAKTDGQLFRIRYFLGCTIAEAAEIMNVSESEVKRCLARARIWLQWKLAGYHQEDSFSC